MWDSIHPSTDWVESHIPAVGLGSLRQVSRHRGLNFMTACIKSTCPCFFLEFMDGCKNKNRSQKAIIRFKRRREQE